jgi:NADH-quinone oxidoreductase subunit K
MNSNNLLICFLLLISLSLFLLKNSFIFFFVALELLFLTINIQWIFFSIQADEITGISVALILIALAAVDAAIGLSLLIRYFSLSMTGKIQISEMIYIKG